MIDEKFVFTGSAKIKVLSLIGVGVLLLVLGILYISRPGYGAHGHGEHETAKTEIKHTEGKVADGEHKDAHGEHHTSPTVMRILKNLWHNNVFFAGIALIGLFFVAFNYVAWAGWGVVFKRVPEAFGYFLPVAGVLMIAVFAFAKHDLFHWTHEYLYDVNDKRYDHIIAGKAGYLNMPFFWTRMIAYFVLWILVWWMLRTFSVKEDIEGGVQYHDKSVIWSAVFLVIFGITSSTSAWDWVLSIDTHYFSTMFGWYVFASWFVTGLSVITLFIMYLKDAGYLKVVNENHLHDLGKYIFAFSIFWTYVWFAQFLLTYYSNIPEEVFYFVERLQNDPYTPIFYINLIANFVFPFLILMTRESKRQSLILKIVCFAVIFGHWTDFYLMMTPGLLRETGAWDFSTLLVELGMTMIFAGIFIYTVLIGLTKANLVPRQHPMLEESVHHHVY